MILSKYHILSVSMKLHDIKSFKRLSAPL